MPARKCLAKRVMMIETAIGGQAPDEQWFHLRLKTAQRNVAREVLDRMRYSG